MKHKKTAMSTTALRQNQERSEMEFVRNYFNHKDWIFQPAMFKFNGLKYSPDFYDAKRNVFIEVAGTRQAYHANKPKFDLFRIAFPKLKYEIRKADGTILNEESRNKNW